MLVLLEVVRVDGGAAASEVAATYTAGAVAAVLLEGGWTRTIELFRTIEVFRIRDQKVGG